MNFYPRPIDVSELDPDRVTAHDLGDGVAAIAVLVGGEPRVFLEQCPHMGGPLAEALFDRARCAIQCPWHGYYYGAMSGWLQENPNEKAMAAIRDCGPTPNFSLVRLDYTRSGGWLYVIR